MSMDPRPLIPNVLTFIRLALGVAFPFLPSGSRWTALIVAGVTEYLDGQLARLLHAPTTTGRILDPVADKIFVASVLATLAWEGIVAPWQLLLVTTRDLCVILGALWVAVVRGPAAFRQMPPTLLGKTATAFQFVLLIAVMMMREVNGVLLAITAALSVAAGIDYITRHRAEARPPSHPDE